MPKIVTATEAKTNFGAMMDWTVTEKDQIIVQSHGQPKAVIINYNDYTRFAAMGKPARPCPCPGFVRPLPSRPPVPANFPGHAPFLTFCLP